MKQNILQMVYDIHAHLHSDDESAAEEFALHMGICGEPEPDEEIIDRFMNFIKAGVKREVVTVTLGERLMPGCTCGAAARGDFERCRCD